MKIRFMSGNAHKITEVQRILAPVGVDIVPVSKKIEELQTEDVESLVRDKLTKAFEAIGRPLFVEHTGLYLSGLNGLPAGLTQIFWDRLQADRFADLVAGLGDAKVTAKTILGYCDG
ncbi:non-canonical purine NTP pyrophosphatase, partial [Burkholderia pseudomallei]